ncbi:MAG: hypothetical protein HY763_00830 [Planctomycetes bacterium]|nr:hypothetical protein [Planctomycetota bacterium]
MATLRKMGVGRNRRAQRSRAVPAPSNFARRFRPRADLCREPHRAWQAWLGHGLPALLLPLLFITVAGFPARADVEVTAKALPARGAIIPIRGEITDVMVESVKRRMDDARKQGAGVLVFELDTPGGLVTSSIAIADLIKNLNDVRPPIRTVAWVNPNAHSGGAIVAVACNEIVMARSSRIGDSQVIMGGLEGVSAVPEDLQPKAYTPVLSEFRASARLNGYDEVLCEAFVIPEREVWWLEHKVTGKREFVFRDEKLKRMGEKSDAGADASDEGEEESDEKVIEETAERIARKLADKMGSRGDGEAAPATGKAAGGTLDADDATARSEWKLVESYYDPVLEREVKVAQPIERVDQLLEMSAGEAQAFGFSKGVVTAESDLRAQYGLTDLLRIELTWSESLSYWLTSMYVRGFLLLLIFLGAYVEFHTPGTGLPGLVALICLAIFVGAPYLTGLANVWEILLIVAGFILIGLEVFVIPGFGVAGILGLAVLLVGLLATFVPEEPGRSFPLFMPSLPATMPYVRTALVTVVFSMAASLLGMFVLSRYLPQLPVLGRIIPANPTPSEVLVDDPYRGAARVGDFGETEGPLRPAGKARFGGLLVDVVTEGEYLEGHTRIEVIERRGNRVVVRAARTV